MMKKITLLYLGQTGAGPVYSLEMAKALANNDNCNLQVIVSENVSNLKEWRAAFSNMNTNASLLVVKAYKHSILSVFFQFFNYHRKSIIVRAIKQFGPDVLYVPFGLMWSRYIYSQIPKHINIIQTIHDVESHDRFNLVETVSSLLTKGSSKYVDGYVILNEKDKLTIHNKYNKPVTVIPHASFGYYFKNNDSKTLTIMNRIGFFGRIEPYKGLDLLVEAFYITKTKGLQLLIAGSGLIDKELQSKIQNNDNIELINRYIQDEEFQPLLDKVDFVVLPYKRASQSGVIPMCFAYGKTVVATNVGALIEQVPLGAGIITEPESQAIASEIDKLYEKPEVIFDYGRFAQKYAEEELSWDRSANLLLSFIDTI
jgi:glycosyltransferase involved in cell wall biosynthesis